MKILPFRKLIFCLTVLPIFFFLPRAIHAAPSTLVIDKFQVASTESGYDEYIEISNYSDSEYKLAGASLIKRTAGNTKYTLVTFDKNLGSGESWLVAHQKSSFASLSDYTYSNTSLSKDSSIYIYSQNSIVDLVSFGGCATGYCEGLPLDNPDPGQIYSRNAGKDTDVNRDDFSLETTALVIDPNSSRLVISELLPSPKTGEEEWFELYNPTNIDISLANLKICDATGSRHCYFFDKNDVLPADGYKTYGQSLTKITLNNSGDWLELYDYADNLLTDSGGNYGAADKGTSLALFGTEFRWTKTATPGSGNIYVDTIELETDADVPTPKVAKSRVIAAKKKKVTTTLTGESDVLLPDTGAGEVKAAVASVQPNAGGVPLIGRQTLGWGLIGLAILLVLGYTFWYFRDYAKDIYDKIKHRNDSARF